MTGGLGACPGIGLNYEWGNFPISEGPIFWIMDGELKPSIIEPASS
jgi:hypothetical protein